MWFDVSYPERLSRLSTLFRGVLLIPLFLFATVLGYLGQSALSAGWIAVFLKKKYPSWLFDSATGYLAWSARVAAYATLLTDRFPSFDAETSPVALEYERPAHGSLSRWQVFLWKAVLLIPHFILLSFTWIALSVVVVIAWFAILVTAKYPGGLFGFVTGILRWYYRVVGYFASFTDRFPPFALSPEAGAASRSSHVISAVLGSLAAIAFGVAIAAIIAFANRAQIVEADYDGLVAGLPAPRMDYRDYDDTPVVSITLERAYDPADGVISITPGRGERLIAFELTYDNRDSQSYRVESAGASLRYLDDLDQGRVGVELLLVDGRATTRVIDADNRVSVIVAFVIPEDAEPTEFRFDPAETASLASIHYQFD